MVKVLACAASVLAAASSQVPDVRVKFAEFEAKFGVKGTSAEREASFDNFAKHLDMIEGLRKTERGTAVYTHLTPFADNSPEEIASRLGFMQSDLDSQTSVVSVDTNNLVDAYDWRDNGFTNFPKNQLGCGSCWTFSVIGNLEGAGFVQTGKLVRLSEQELLECSSKDTGIGKGNTNIGCKGGSTSLTMQWLIDNGLGVEYEEDYPYTHVSTQKCSHTKTNDILLKIDSFITFPKNEEQIAAALVQYGPLSICANANNWHGYESGIYDQEPCIHAGLNHGVLLVGFGTDKELPYWTVRNSWGYGFGEKGHLRLARGKGMCGVQKLAISAEGIKIDNTRPEPPFILGPSCCANPDLNINTDEECHAFCKNNGGWKSFTSPGPYCECYNGKGCKPYPECNDDANVTLV